MMAERLADIEARIGTVHKLSAVITAMRGIAASRAQEARRHLDSIRTYATTIGDAIGQALAFLPEAGRPGPAAAGSGRHALVMLCAEQGFVGSFSGRVLDAAGEILRANPGTGHDLLLVGDRGLPAAAERGLSVAWSDAMIGHPAQTGALAGRITGAIYERLARGELAQVSVIHTIPGQTGEPEILNKRLVPFDFSRFPASRTAIAPRITLPPGRLLARLVEEYVFAELSEAVMLSFAAENEARMRSMIAAHDNVAETLDGLVATSRRLRQEEITDEIVELATSSLPVR